MPKRYECAVAYLRTSSAANVGPDKDSDKRQRAAIEAFARRAGFTIVGEYYDAAVSGADPVDKRVGFTAFSRLKWRFTAQRDRGGRQHNPLARRMAQSRCRVDVRRGSPRVSCALRRR